MLLLRSATVIDPSDGTRHPGTDVLVDSGTITGVHPGIEAPAGAETVDLTGRYVVRRPAAGGVFGASTRPACRC